MRLKTLTVRLQDAPSRLHMTMTMRHPGDLDGRFRVLRFFERSGGGRVLRLLDAVPAGRVLLVT